VKYNKRKIFWTIILDSGRKRYKHKRFAKNERGVANKKFNLTFVLSRNLLKPSASSRKFRANFCLRQKTQMQVNLMFCGRLRRKEEKMYNEKRMPRFERIPIMEAPPKIEEWYIKQKYSDDRISVFKLRDMININEKSEEKFFKDLNNYQTDDQIHENKQLLKRIENENRIEELIKIYDSGEARNILVDITKKMIEIDDNIYKIYIEKLKNKYSETGFDNIFMILAKTSDRKDISTDIIDILKNNYIRDPQDFASLIQILGLCNNQDVLKYLYTFYGYFVNNFANESYFEGPLLGISYYIKGKRRTIAST
jgi:hypothetical protein